MENRWTRRVFLKGFALGMIGFGVGGLPRFLERFLQNTEANGISGRRRTLVILFKRGAMDSLMAVPPLHDARLLHLRPHLAMSTEAIAASPGIAALSEGFGLHPAFASLVPLWKEGMFAPIHGVGSTNPTRSHFDAQNYMETGTPFRKGTPSGWLNRALSMMEPSQAPFRAISLTHSLPLSLAGPEPAMAVADLSQLHLINDLRPEKTSPSNQGFETLYEETSQKLLHEAGSESFEAFRALDAVDQASAETGSSYPNTKLGRAMRQIAFLIKERVGLEVAFAESEGWDTHVKQGTSDGEFARAATDLADSIAAFWADLGDHREDVVLLTMTEFGRSVQENGSLGTDHGRASCSFILGTGVKGGQVHGAIPVLREEELEDGRDLPVTIDFRSVFMEVAASHLGIHDKKKLFPDWDGDRFRLFS